MLFSPESLILVISSFVIFRIFPSEKDNVWKMLFLLTVATGVVVVYSISIFSALFILSCLIIIFKSALTTCGKHFVSTSIIPSVIGLAFIVASNWRNFSIPILLAVFALLERSIRVIVERIDSIWGKFLIMSAPFYVLLLTQYWDASFVNIALASIVIASFGNYRKRNQTFTVIWPALVTALVLFAQLAISLYTPNNGQFTFSTDQIATQITDGEYWEAVKTIRAQSGAQQYMIQYFPSKSSFRSFIKSVARSLLMVHSVLLIVVVMYRKIAAGMRK